MIGLLRRGALAMALSLAAVPAHAGELCGWLVETVGENDTHQFELWLQAEHPTDVLYKMTGRVTASSRPDSPSRGVVTLQQDPVRVWGYASTVSAPADFNIIAEIHAPPRDAFPDEPTPVLARFSFRRHDSAGYEGVPARPFASRQCVVLG